MSEKMKDSRIAWIGETPEEWLVAPVSCMSNSRSGGTPDRNNMNYWDNGTIPWMSSGEVNKINVYETDEKITEAATRGSSAKVIKKNAVMVALNGQGKTKGMSAVLRIDSACNQSLCAFSCHEERLYYEYLFWCFQSMYTYLRQMSGDDVRDGLAASYVRKRKIPVPPLPEQHAIAAYLDRKCGQIDDIIADLRRQIECLQSYKKSLISETVTKGLNPEAPMKDSGIEWIGQIPEHWEVSRLKYCCEVKTGPFGTQLSAEEYADEGVPIINVKNIGYGFIKDDDLDRIPNAVKERLSTHVLQRGDIVFGRKGAVDKHAIINVQHDGWVQGSDCMRVRIKSEIISEFLNYYFGAVGYGEYVLVNSVGATMASVNAEILNNSVIVFPGLDEQQAIATYLDRKCAEIDTILDDKRRQVENMKNHRKSVIYEYVTGKKRVKEV